MAVKVYTISDPLAIDFIVGNDIDSFKEYLDSDDTLYFNEPEEFATEAEALLFAAASVMAPTSGPFPNATPSTAPSLTICPSSKLSKTTDESDF